MCESNMKERRDSHLYSILAKLIFIIINKPISVHELLNLPYKKEHNDTSVTKRRCLQIYWSKYIKIHTNSHLYTIIHSGWTSDQT